MVSMDKVVVRYGEIGSKSRNVRSRMSKVLRQRVEDRLNHENIDYENVSKKDARISLRTSEAVKVAEILSEIPGVSSVSPAIEVKPELERLEESVEELQIGDSFGVEAQRSGNHDFDSQDVERCLGSAIEERTGSEVDLDGPETLVEVDLRQERAFVFTQRFDGPNGLPIGSSDDVLALISGGIDSPVAAYEAMTRGCDITPVYFYNRPFAAEDHLIRFESVIEKLKRFHPSKDWSYYIVDMQKVNKKLMELGRGRMLVHRSLMYRVADKIAKDNGKEAIVSGESIGQKSSQTPSNMSLTTSGLEKAVFRPLATEDKPSISEKARELETFEDAVVNSSCRSLAPENPAVSMSRADFQGLKEEIGFEELVEKAVDSIEERDI